MTPAYIPATILLTGATGGIGQAIARRFAAAGNRLILTGRDEKKLSELVAEFKTPTYSFACDIRDRTAIEKAHAMLPAAFQQIDLLINNAGLALGLEKAPEASLDDWETMIDANIKGLAVWTRLVLPGMVARRQGHIINMGSISGSYPYPGGHVYCGTKAFVKQFSLALRADLNDTGVRVTDIEPGMVQSDFSLHRFKGDAARAAKIYENANPLTPDDVAESVFWAATLPPHVNVNRIELMPTTQAPGPLSIHRAAAPAKA